MLYSPTSLAVHGHVTRRLTLKELYEHLKIRDLSLELVDQVTLHSQRVDKLAHGGIHLRFQLFLTQRHQVVSVQVEASLQLFCKVSMSVTHAAEAMQHLFNERTR